MQYGLPNIIGYRMDRQGNLHIREVGNKERQATREEINYLLTERPDLILQLAQQAY
ncbi:MAG: hypothetical protein VW169_14105 [Rhodospirillaceae bacterium]|jgi:Ribonuclease G/E